MEKRTKKVETGISGCNGNHSFRSKFNIHAVGCVQKEAPSQGPRPKMKISVGPFLEGLKVSFECFLYCDLPYPGEAGIISTILTSDAVSQALPEI